MSSQVYRVFPPAPELQALVGYYWVLRCGAAGATDPPPTRDLTLPDGYGEVVFSYAAPYARVDLTSSEERHVAASNVVGLRSGSSASGRTSGALDLLGVKLTPLGMRLSVGVPPRELANRVVSFADLKGERGAARLQELESRLFDASTDEARIAILNQHFAALSTGAPAEDPLVTEALAVLSSPRQGNVLAIASMLHVSPRTLIRRFSNATGLSPKQAFRPLRFRAYYRHLVDRGGEVAPGAFLDFGYCDQSHSIRDFQHFVGASPLSQLRGKGVFADDVERASTLARSL